MWNLEFTLTLGPARARSSMMSSGFWTKDKATQSMERVRANSKSLGEEEGWKSGGRGGGGGGRSGGGGGRGE